MNDKVILKMHSQMHNCFEDWQWTLFGDSGGLFPAGVEIAKMWYVSLHLCFHWEYFLIIFCARILMSHVCSPFISGWISCWCFDFARLDKGVVVYIADSMGVRDIYDTNGSAAISIKEPLAVLVSLFNILKYPLYSVTFSTVKRTMF